MIIEKEISAAAKEIKAVAKEIKAGFNEMSIGYKLIRNTAKRLQSLRGTSLRQAQAPWSAVVELVETRSSQ